MTVASTSTTPVVEVARARPNLGLIASLWRRDVLRFRKDTGRWVGVVLQPVLLWVVLGTGMGRVFGPDYHLYFLPGLLAMIALFTAIFATMAVIEDRQRGFLQQVLAAPGSKGAMVVGKTLGVLTVALFQLVLTLPAIPLAGFDVTAVDWPLLFGSFALGTATLTAASFMLAWVVSSAAGYHALMGVLLVPLWLVSGALFPLTNTGWLATIAAANPLTYMVDGLRHALGGDATQTQSTPLVALAVLAGLTLITLTLASRVARRPVGTPE